MAVSQKEKITIILRSEFDWVYTQELNAESPRGICTLVFTAVPLCTIAKMGPTQIYTLIDK